MSAWLIRWDSAAWHNSGQILKGIGLRPGFPGKTPRMLAFKKRSLLITLRNAVGWNAAVWKNQWTSKIFLAGEVLGCRSPEMIETANGGRRKISGPAKYLWLEKCS